MRTLDCSTWYNRLFCQWLPEIVTCRAGTGPQPTSYPAYATEPKDWKGYGADCFWLYVEPDALGDAMLKYGVNMTHIEIFNCSPSKAASQSIDPSPHGYWQTRFTELQSPLDKFLTAMQKRKIVTVLTFFGGHDMSTVTADRLIGILDWLQARSTGTDGILPCLAAEPTTQWTVKFYYLSARLQGRWPAAKIWNYGTRPVNCPTGYWIEYHPQEIHEYGISNTNSLVLADSGIWYDLNQDRSLQAKIDPAKLIEYAQKVRDNGNGFCHYGQRFTGWDIDIEGIKAIGGLR